MAHVSPAQRRAGLKSQQYQLLYCRLRRVSVNRGHRPRMTRVDCSQKGQCFHAAELTQDDSVRPQPERRCHEVVGRDLGFAKAATHRDKTDMVCVFDMQLDEGETALLPIG